MYPMQEVLRRLAALESHTSGEGSGTAVAANHQSSINGATIGPSAPVTYDAPVFHTKTGKVRVTASGTVLGGTTVANETLNASIIINGVGSGMTQSFDASATIKGGAFSFTQEFTGFAIGEALTIGVQIVNVTTPAHTLEISANEGCLVIEDVL